MRWIKEIDHEAEYILTGDEICLLAALLDAPEIYGVRNAIYGKNEVETTHIIRGIIERFEKRKMLETGVEGEIAMDRKLYRMIDTIAYAEELVGIDIVTSGKIERSCYCYQKEGCFLSLDQNNRKYKLFFWNSWEEALSQSFDIKSDLCMEIEDPEIRITKEQIEKIRGCQNSFQQDDAKEYICNYISKDDMQYVYKLIEGQGKYIQFYRSKEVNDLRGITFVMIEDKLFRLVLIDAEKIGLRRIEEWEA